MFKRFIPLAILLLLGLFSHAQDVHFSMVQNAPFLINPALTGYFRGSDRFILNYKDQWGSLTENPYKTVAFSYDRAVYKNSFFAGMNFFSDRAGDADMGLTQLSLNIASKVKVEKNDYLKVGIQGAWLQYSFTTDNLTWNSQFNGQMIDPDLSSNENYTKEKSQYVDFSTGILWTHTLRNDEEFNLGVSAFHISQPVYSFESHDELFVRWVFFGDYSTPVMQSKIKLYPSFLLMLQGPSTEIDLGITAKYFYGTGTRLVGTPSYISLGILYRYQDAIILCTGFNFEGLMDIALGYDINLSDLSGAKGGVELSLSYTIPEKTTHLVKRIK
jgi:type IX secretion system PorP/SprF family membrane protein